MTELPPTSFAVIPGKQVHETLRGRHAHVVGIVEDAYLAHGAGRTVNPPSYFLRFPDRPTDRIIALPASISAGAATDGVKWIASVPRNVERGLPRASAVLVLNEPGTGYPFACLEASIISATRTAASAVLAADRLSAGGERPARIGFVGAGLIARYVYDYLRGTGWVFSEIGVHDLVREYAVRFGAHIEESASTEVAVHDSVESLIRSSDLIVFATVAAEPYVHDPGWFGHNPLVLNVSLRDVGTDVILSSVNVVDDIEHCLKAGTSVHLAEQRTGTREFVDGTLYDVLTGALKPRRDRPIVFSPFGLGVLDLAVGRSIYDEVRAAGQLHLVPDFFHDLDRYGRTAGAPE